MEFEIKQVCIVKNKQGKFKYAVEKKRVFMLIIEKPYNIFIKPYRIF